jgi:hypothetical protein
MSEQPTILDDLLPRPRPHRFILEDRKPVPCDDLLTWAAWIEASNRSVGNDVIHTLLGRVRVSTVFLGLDHSFGGPIPLLFETMIFGGALDGTMFRSCNWDAAVAAHKTFVGLARKGKYNAFFWWERLRRSHHWSWLRFRWRRLKSSIRQLLSS